jgi:ribose transport system permease protein
MYAVFAVLRPEQFANFDNIRIIATSQAVVLILAVAVTFPLRAGDFDLSIGSTMILAASLVAVLTRDGMPWPLAIAVALLAGLAVGAFNAFAVVVVGLAPFIITLGSLMVVEGLALAVTNAEFIAGLPVDLRTPFTNRVMGLPLAVWYGWLLAGVAWFVQSRQTFGRHLLFTGWDRSAARRNGIRVGSVRAAAFIVSSTLSAFAGVVFAATLGAVDPVAGISFVLTPYAAAFLGTTTIALGRFNVIGTLVGIYFLGIGVSGLQLLGASFWVSSVFDGVALIVAVTFARLVQGRKDET